MKPSKNIRSIVVVLSSSLAAACSLFLPSWGMAQTASEPVIHLNQAWSQDDREWYYHFSQGSAVLSYDIFLNLEVADGQEVFRSAANSERYGLIPEAANGMNPDGLPIGISKTTVSTPIKGWPAGDYAGLTCAACHEGEWEYKGKHVRIDGSTGNRLDIMAYTYALDGAAGNPVRFREIRSIGRPARSVERRCEDQSAQALSARR